jgi:peptidoglycan glycosyltransferase
VRRIYRYRRKRTRLARAHSGAITRARIQAVLTLMLFAGVLALFALAGVGFMIYRAYAHDLKTPEQAIAESTIGTSLVFDRSGQTKLYEFTDDLGGLKDPKPLTEISPWLIAATVTTEDASFYGNPGVNFRGLARAAVENLTPFGPGFLEGSGGSSITQQLVKNVYVPREERGARRVERKVKESVIALELKRKYDDDQILEWYLNQIITGTSPMAPKPRQSNISASPRRTSRWERLLCSLVCRRRRAFTHPRFRRTGRSRSSGNSRFST